MRLVVVSDTPISKVNNRLVILESPLREIEALSERFSEIIWLGYYRNGFENASRPPRNSIIKLIPLPESGGENLYAKFSVLLKIPTYVKCIYKYLKSADIVHFRLPSISGLIGIILNLYFNKTKGWIKYAGTWTEAAPLSYSLQRSVLKVYKLLPITILSKKEASDNLHYIPNPSIYKEELKTNLNIAKRKSFNEKMNMIYVGSLNHNKRPDLVLKVFTRLMNHQRMGVLNIIGDGELYDSLRNKISDKNRIFLRGFCSRDQIDYYYSISHILVCPSISEGFPKVIPESISFGCIPVVSSLDGIKDFILHKKTGWLLEQINFENNLEQGIKELLENKRLSSIISKNAMLKVRMFTYENFKNSIYKFCF